MFAASITITMSIIRPKIKKFHRHERKHSRNVSSSFFNYPCVITKEKKHQSKTIHGVLIKMK